MCQARSRPFINLPTEKENQLSQVYILFECTFAFLHLADRTACRLLGPEGRTKLLNEAVVPDIADAIIELVVGHWPQELQSCVRHEFFEKLNNATLEYAACENMVEFLKRFAQKVTALAGRPMDTAVIEQVDLSHRGILAGGISRTGE